MDLASLLHTLFRKALRNMYSIECIFAHVCGVRLGLRACDRADEYAFSLKVTGVVSANARRSQLLHQDADHVDEDNEVHLQANK